MKQTTATESSIIGIATETNDIDIVTECSSEVPCRGTGILFGDIVID